MIDHRLISEELQHTNLMHNVKHSPSLADSLTDFLVYISVINTVRCRYCGVGVVGMDAPHTLERPGTFMMALLSPKRAQDSILIEEQGLPIP